METFIADVSCATVLEIRFWSLVTVKYPLLPLGADAMTTSRIFPLRTLTSLATFFFGKNPLVPSMPKLKMYP